MGKRDDEMSGAAAAGSTDISASVERAIVELQAQNLEGVIEQLLIAWRASRSVILAEAIEAVSAKLAEGVSPIEGRTYALRHKAWLAREEERRQADIPMLLDSISTHEAAETTEEAERVLAWEPDPRVTVPVVRVATKVKYPVLKSDRVMELLVDVLLRHLDPRMIDLIAKQPDWRVRMKAHRAVELARRAPQDYPLTESDEAAMIRARDLILAPFKQSSAEAAHDVDALYQAVYDDPEDDGARAVLSDALQQTNDPRGRLIALTMAGAGAVGMTKKAKQQADAILERHRDEFLGKLKDYLKDARFERGFLASATVTTAAWNEERRQWIRELPRELVAERTWCTAHTLYFGVDNMDVVFELVNSPKMRALRTLGLASMSMRAADSVEQLAKLDQMGVVLPERIDRFHLCGPESTYSTSDYQSTGFVPQQTELIARTKVLQHIKHLEIHGQGQTYTGDPRPAHYEWLWESELGQRIEDLTLVVKRKTFLIDPWMARDADAQLRRIPVKRIVFALEHHGDGPQMVLHRGEDGRRLRSLECTNLDAETFRAIALTVKRSNVPFDEVMFCGRPPVASVRKDMDAILAEARQKPKKLVFSGADNS